MKDNINNLKEMTDFVLKDIHVTKELKIKTLEKCKKEKSIKLKPLWATGISAALITFTVTGYQYFYDKIEKKYNYSKSNIEEPIKNMDTIIKKSNSNSSELAHNTLNSPPYKEDFNYKQTPKDYSIPDASKTNNSSELKINKSESVIKNSENNIVNNKSSENVNSKGTSSEISSEDKSNIDKSSSDNTELAPDKNIKNSFNTTTLAKAEKHFGSNIAVPKYIPEGFELTDISIPEDTSKETYVSMIYSSDKGYFKITQNKSTIYNGSGKKINFNGIAAYLTEEKKDYISNPSTVQLTWIKKDIQYTISGNISTDSIITIAKSIN